MVEAMISSNPAASGLRRRTLGGNTGQSVGGKHVTIARPGGGAHPASLHSRVGAENIQPNHGRAAAAGAQYELNHTGSMFQMGPATGTNEVVKAQPGGQAAEPISVNLKLR